MTDQEKTRAPRAPLTLDQKIDRMRGPKLAALEKVERTVATKRVELEQAEAKLVQAKRDLVRVDKMIASSQLEDDEQLRLEQAAQ